MRRSACGTGSPACWASLPVLCLAPGWAGTLLWKQPSEGIWQTGRCWGTIPHLQRHSRALMETCAVCHFAGTEWSHILCFLETTGIMTFASYEGVQREIFYIWISFPLSFKIKYTWGLFSFCMYPTCFSMFSRGRWHEAKVDEMDDLLLNLPVSPKIIPCLGSCQPRSESCPWPALGAASAQMLPSFRAGRSSTRWYITTVTRHFPVHCWGRIQKGTNLLNPKPLGNILNSELQKKIKLVKQYSLKACTCKSEKLFSRYHSQDLVHRLKCPDRNFYMWGRYLSCIKWRSHAYPLSNVTKIKN